ncbi:MAG: hypothetical protein KF841_05080 [Phycisphaerae bacterium]|nr:hypothetical protein [Phycisphaerae bacterium]
MKRNVMLSLAFAFMCGWVSPTGALAQTDPNRFSLGKAIPEDVFIAVVARSNPERKFLDDYWSEVTKAVSDSGVLNDVWDMFVDAVIDDEQMDKIDDTVERFSTLFKNVKWSDIFEKEFVYCGRFNPGTPAFHEGMFIGRADKDGASANYSALRKLLAEFVKFVNEEAGESVLALEESKQEGASITTLTFPAAPGITVSVANHQDAIFIAFGSPAILKDGINLMSGKGEAKSLIASSRFKQAFEKLPPAEDQLVFWDVENMMATFRQMSAMFAGPEPKADAEGSGAANDGNPMKAVSAILHDLSVIDYVASVEWTDGFRVMSDAATVLRSGAKSSPIYDIITSGKPIANFERFIPMEADSFSVSAGIDMTKVYRYLIDLVTKHAPDGKAKIEEWGQIQKNELGLDVEKDVLALFQGSTVQYADGKDWVVLAGITDAAKMDSQLNRLFTFINQLLGQQNGLMISKVNVADKVEFRQISHPMMMMMGGLQPPVIGCAEGHLILGSSAKAVKKCLQTAAGSHQNITKNKRWQSEALMPDGSVVSISFTDQANMGQELQQAIAGISMGLGMMGMMMADAPPQVRTMVSNLPPILAKLGPVAGRLDFYKSKASYESFDGQRWIIHDVQNYKKPNERPSRLEESTEPAEASGDGANKADGDSSNE